MDVVFTGDHGLRSEGALCTQARSRYESPKRTSDRPEPAETQLTLGLETEVRVVSGPMVERPGRGWDDGCLPYQLIDGTRLNERRHRNGNRGSWGWSMGTRYGRAGLEGVAGASAVGRLAAQGGTWRSRRMRSRWACGRTGRQCG